MSRSFPHPVSSIHLAAIITELRREGVHSEEHHIPGLTHPRTDHPIDRGMVGRVVLLESAINFLDGQSLVEAQHVSLDGAAHQVLVVRGSIRVRQEAREARKYAHSSSLSDHLPTDRPRADVPAPVRAQPLAIVGRCPKRSWDSSGGMLAGQDEGSGVR